MSLSKRIHKYDPKLPGPFIRPCKKPVQRLVTLWKIHLQTNPEQVHTEPRGGVSVKVFVWNRPGQRFSTLGSLRHVWACVKMRAVPSAQKFCSSGSGVETVRNTGPAQHCQEEGGEWESPCHSHRANRPRWNPGPGFSVHRAFSLQCYFWPNSLLEEGGLLTQGLGSWCEAGRGKKVREVALLGTYTARSLGTLERRQTLGPNAGPRSLGRGTLIAGRCVRSRAAPLPEWNVNGMVAQSLPELPRSKVTIKGSKCQL